MNPTPEPCGAVQYRDTMYCQRCNKGWNVNDSDQVLCGPIAEDIRRATVAKQERIDSAMEAVVNTAIGFFVSLITWQVVSWAMNIPVTMSQNLLIIGIFTVVSILRQYVLRRLFNGRSVWCSITGRV